jgi:TATA-box binding protein (TBP) (component of TFIID and TFIIIB)
MTYSRDTVTYAAMAVATKKAIKDHMAEVVDDVTMASIRKSIQEQVDNIVQSCSVTYNMDLEQLIHVAYQDSNSLPDVVSMKIPHMDLSGLIG